MRVSTGLLFLNEHLMCCGTTDSGNAHCRLISELASTVHRRSQLPRVHLASHRRQQGGNRLVDLQPYTSRTKRSLSHVRMQKEQKNGFGRDKILGLCTSTIIDPGKPVLLQKQNMTIQLKE